MYTPSAYQPYAFMRYFSRCESDAFGGSSDCPEPPGDEGEGEREELTAITFYIAAATCGFCY